MAKARKGGLGRGLGALISSRDEDRTGAGLPEDTSDRVLQLDPRTIGPNPAQPRKTFNEESLQELAASIKQDGVQEPVIVRFVKGQYELVSGERRVRATVLAGLPRVPAICRDVSDDDLLRLGLIENIQRDDLNPIELAGAYRALQDQSDWTQAELADQVGKNRATVANTMRLLNLPRDVQRSLGRGEISMGHARALLALKTPREQSDGCRRIIDEGLSVRQAEQLASPPKPRPKPKPPVKDPNVAMIEDELRRTLGTKVTVRNAAKNRGKIEIEYYNLDDLERLLELLRNTGRS